MPHLYSAANGAEEALRGARQVRLSTAETCRGVLALRSRALRQHATAHSPARSERPRGVVSAAVAVGGGWRRWPHRAEERWARQWRRICEAAVRARRGEGKGLGAAPCGRAVGQEGGE